jgi:ribA/ribD-fused uncharacterized protein
MMAAKARIFGDKDIEQQIMRTLDPRELKALGRKVSNYDEDTWVAKRNKVMFDGCLAKFSQNKELYEALLKTGSLHIVEASPSDAIWGIGLAQDDPRALDPAQWLGLNLLGNALMRVRTELQILHPPLPHPQLF